MQKSSVLKFSVYDVVFCALMLAMQIVLSRFLSIQTPFVKFGFAFIPISIVAMLYGMPASIPVCALSDLIGALLFPTGPYFPGFTLTAALMGVSFGFFLKDLPAVGKGKALCRIAAAIFINQFILSLFLNSYWITFTASKGFSFFIVTRFTSSCTDFVVQTAVIYLLYRLRIVSTLQKYRKRT